MVTTPEAMHWSHLDGVVESIRDVTKGICMPFSFILLVLYVIFEQCSRSLLQTVVAGYFFLLVLLF